MSPQVCARVNQGLNLKEPHLADAIMRASEEIREDKVKNQFPIDVFQMGSGTSTNMNVHKVIAARAIVLNPIMGYDKAVEVVKRALKENKTVKQGAVEMNYLSEGEAGKICKPEIMTRPRFSDERNL